MNIYGFRGGKKTNPGGLVIFNLSEQLLTVSSTNKQTKNNKQANKNNNKQTINKQTINKQTKNNKQAKE